jgi:hypothetical protein
VIGRVFWVALVSGLACLAQDGTATLTGTVADPLGSPLENAKAQLISEETDGLRFSLQTDKLGQFRFADIPPATYRLEISSLGFDPRRKIGIRLSAGQAVTLPIFVLNLGMCGSGPPVDALQHLAPGEDSGTLRDKVVKSSGAPVVGASVSLNCARCVTTTNREGRFAFSHLRPGAYTLAVSMTGFYREIVAEYLVVQNLIALISRFGWKSATQGIAPASHSSRNVNSLSPAASI